MNRNLYYFLSPLPLLAFIGSAKLFYSSDSTSLAGQPIFIGLSVLFSLILFINGGKLIKNAAVEDLKGLKIARIIAGSALFLAILWMIILIPLMFLVASPA